MAKGSGSAGRSQTKRDIRNWKSEIRAGEKLLRGKTLSATARSNWERDIASLRRRVAEAERSL